jgi:hypothetical protein
MHARENIRHLTSGRLTMGIDIVAYRNIRKTDIALVRDEDGYVMEREGCIFLDRRVSDSFEVAHEGLYGTHPGYFDGLDDSVYYEVDQEVCPISVAYSTYNTFRDLLDEYAVRELGDARLFREMIEFSDCDGTFGPVVCEKLLSDFKAHRDGFFGYADKVLDEDGWFSADFAKNLYDNYIEALSEGADNGVMLYE